MKKCILYLFLLIFLSPRLYAQLSPGDTALDFELMGVDGKMTSLTQFSDSKGVILIFTSNYCPFSKAYENRIIRLHKNLASYGYPVIAINPNDKNLSPDDSLEEMVSLAKKKQFPFIYLKDDSNIYKAYGASRTPQCFLLQNKGGGTFVVAYIGAIDNNAMDARSISEKYLEQAIIALENGTKPDPGQTEAIGCTIKNK